MNRQDDEPNPALRLAARAGKMALSFPLGITHCVPQENDVLFILNPLLTKLVQSRRLDIGRFIFCVFVDLNFVSVHKQTKQILHANIWPCWPHDWPINLYI